MKIIRSNTWREHDGLIKKLIREKNRQEKVIDFQHEYISKLQKENAALKLKIIALKGEGWSGKAINIDYPNSTEGGFEDSNIFLL